MLLITPPKVPCQLACREARPSGDHAHAHRGASDWIRMQHDGWRWRSVIGFRICCHDGARALPSNPPTRSSPRWEDCLQLQSRGIGLFPRCQMNTYAREIVRLRPGLPSVCVRGNHLGPYV